MKTFKTKPAALKAARQALGDAVEGIDFNLRNTGAGWVYEEIPGSNALAVEEKAAKATPNKLKGRGFASKPKAPQKTKAAGDGKEPPAKPQAPASDAPKAASKTDMLIAMMNKPGGATSKEMEDAAGWQPHSVRGLIGTLKKKGVAIIGKKLKGEPTIYQIAKAAMEPLVGEVI